MQTLTKFERGKADLEQLAFNNIAVEAEQPADLSRFVVMIIMALVRWMTVVKNALADCALIALQFAQFRNKSEVEAFFLAPRMLMRSILRVITLLLFVVSGSLLWISQDLALRCKLLRTNTFAIFFSVASHVFDPLRFPVRVSTQFLSEFAIVIAHLFSSYFAPAPGALQKFSPFLHRALRFRFHVRFSLGLSGGQLYDRLTGESIFVNAHVSA